MKKNFTFLKAMLIVALLGMFGMGANAQYSGAGTFTKITDISEFESGSYYILYGINGSYKGAMSNSISGGRMKAAAITISGADINDPDGSIVWKIEGSATSGYTLYNESANVFCEIKTNSTKGFSTSPASTHTYTVSSTGDDFKFMTNHTNGGDRGISIYRTDFRPYASTKTLNLYKYAVASTSVATPSFIVKGTEKSADEYYVTADVTIRSATDGATIYYTTDGSAPTTGSMTYSSPVTITSTTTFRAIAVKSGLDNSEIAEKTITISVPATATIPYSEAFNNTLGDWLPYEVVGTKEWTATADGAYVNGYNGGNVEAWLISPQFTAAASGLAISFNYASKYTGNNLIVKVSSNYPGYGDPSTATWTDMSSIKAVADNYTIKNSGILITPKAGNLHFALVYAASASYSDWRITNLSVNLPSSDPTITLTGNNPLTGFDYVQGNGPSGEQTFSVSGINLTAAMTITAPTNYEISTTSGSGFVNTLTLTPTGGNVDVTTIYIRLISGLAAGSYNGDLTTSSTGATSQTITCNATVSTPPTMPNVIISEVYGGGGNSGATYKNDFIELYNTSQNKVDISGWSIQYYSATGTSPTVYEIPANSTIGVGDHFLIECAGGATGSALPTPDASCTISMSATKGKVILFNTNVAQTIIMDIASILTNSNFVDYLPYGTSAVPVWGSAMSMNPSNTKSASRKSSSTRSANATNYVYSGNIGSDFLTAEPTPQSTIAVSIDNRISVVKIYSSHGQLIVEADESVKIIEIFNAFGQKVAEKAAVKGVNTIPVQKGLLIVKAGNYTAKVLVK